MPIILFIRLIVLFIISTIILTILHICNIIDWSWVYIVTPLVSTAIVGVFSLIYLRHWYLIAGISSILLSMLLMDSWGFIQVSWWDLYIVLTLILSTVPIGILFILAFDSP